MSFHGAADDILFCGSTPPTFSSRVVAVPVAVTEPSVGFAYSRTGFEKPAGRTAGVFL
jgi:hypothetical protein